MIKRHDVVVMMNNVRIVMQKTQMEIVDLLQMEGVELVSVNSQNHVYGRQKRKQKSPVKRSMHK